jgi:hypothetical protein
LLDLALDLLRAATELHPPQLGDQQLKMLDLTPVRPQPRTAAGPHFAN